MLLAPVPSGAAPGLAFGCGSGDGGGDDDDDDDDDAGDGDDHAVTRDEVQYGRKEEYELMSATIR